MIESTAVLRRRRFHRQKAHLVWSAMRHRAAELGDRVLYVQAETYAQALAQVGEPVIVRQPTSHAADAFCRGRSDVTVLPDAGFATPREEFEKWASGRGGRRLVMEDFYREQRRRFGVLMDGVEPVGGRWNLDHDNREPPPKGVTSLGLPEPYWPREDEIDDQVRQDLDRLEQSGVAFVGDDGLRWAPVDRAQALRALRRFVSHRLPTFGPTEDAMLAGDRWMSHSALSVPMNLGLLHPVEVAEAADAAYRAGAVPLASAEGFVRQVLGWREYVWGLYWHWGPGSSDTDYRGRNALGAHEPVPDWLENLDAAGEVTAACLAGVLTDVREAGWAHHIPRLMVLGSYAMQRGVDPAALTDWFHRSFLDGYDWVMLPNVVGMSQHADGGLMATKPYTSGGAYIDRMSDFCGGCRYDPKRRTGPTACPFTAGYWSFLHHHRRRFAGSPRMGRAVAGLDRLADADQVRREVDDKGLEAP